jgi:aspartyl-tRNA(Asn)/glutamyl-tRNA(Gln) amidotransferase subunit A
MGKRLITSLISLKQLSERIKNGDISPVDLVEVCFDRIKKFNPTLNAFISIIEKDALYKQAQMAETEIKRGKYLGPLHGIPFSIKDIFCVKGIRCTAGSMILSKYIADADSTAVKRMKKAGAILIGTNNLNEFACGITGINPFMVPRKIPGIAQEFPADLAAVLLLPLQQGWLSFPWVQIRVDQLESHLPFAV